MHTTTYIETYQKDITAYIETYKSTSLHPLNPTILINNLNYISRDGQL